MEKPPKARCPRAAESPASSKLTAQPQTLSYTVISNGSWTVTDYPYWTELTVETGASGADSDIAH